MRFLAPYAGVGIDQRIWVVHPVMGIPIAVSAIWLFGIRTDVPGDPRAPQPDGRALTRDGALRA
ncbi:MAG: hypothetical protein ICV72_08920 [Aldersonia sp.]|nr:hypothetical protein [Aldersonia sp.]